MVYYALLCFLVEEENEENDEAEERSLKVVAKFSSENQFNNINDAGYDVVLHLANEWEDMPENCHIQMIECISSSDGEITRPGSIWDLSHLNEHGWPK